MTTPTYDPTATSPDATLPAMKPGWQTTEFWATHIFALLSLATALGWIGPNFSKDHEQVVNAAALVAAVLAPSIYALSRGITKHGHIQAVARVLTQQIASNVVSANPKVPLAPADPATGAGADPASGFALLGLIGGICLVVGAVLTLVAAVHSAVSVPGLILAGVGLVLLYFDGGFGRRVR